MNDYIGEIRLMPYSFVPDGWIRCEGQMVSIMQYPALFQLIYVEFGGDARRCFGIPNLRSASPIMKENSSDSSKKECMAYCICVNGIYPQY